MALKKFNPVTPGQRFKLISTFDEITTATPEKSLLTPQRRSGGRNNTGKMTMRYLGGGHKKMYRVIDFKREKENIPATVKSVEYDPNRSARIALVVYADGEKRYIIAPHGLQVGQVIMAGAGISSDLGNTLFLSEMPFCTVNYNNELCSGQRAKMARKAGLYSPILTRDGEKYNLQPTFGETRMILTTCKATIGMCSNVEHNLEVSGKAGRSRWQGRRPRVRGVVMNPVDHPMGGGEGRSSGGHPRSRKGLPSKGYKTRSPKSRSNRYIIESRKK